MTSEFVAVDMNSKDDTSSSSSVAAGFNGSTGLIERAPHEKSDTEFKSSMNYLNESKRNEHYDMQYHMKAGCGTKETNKYWCSNRDTCGVICGSVTWILLVFAEICVVFVVLDVRYKDMFGYDIVSHIESADIIDADHAASSNLGDDDFSGYSMKFKFLNAAFYSLFIILALTSHLRAMFTNPGATPHDAVPLEYNGSDNIKIQQERYCKYCDAYKPPRAHHCSICGRCIVKMDHHCPWVNNCVGVGNQKYFVLFLLYTFTSCFYTLVLIIYKVGHCSGSRARYDMHGNLRHEPLNYHECGLNVTKATMQLLVAIEAVLFGLFTFCMMCDQWNMAVFAETQIDRLKGGRRKGRKWTKCENLSEVFGGPPRFSFWWLLPVKFAYLNPDRVYGFRTRDRRPSLSDSSSIGQDGTSSLPAFNQNDVHSQLVPKASKEFIDPESQSDTRFESKRDD